MAGILEAKMPFFQLSKRLADSLIIRFVCRRIRLRGAESACSFEGRAAELVDKAQHQSCAAADLWQESEGRERYLFE